MHKYANVPSSRLANKETGEKGGVGPGREIDEHAREGTGRVKLKSWKTDCHQNKIQRTGITVMGEGYRKKEEKSAHKQDVRDIRGDLLENTLFSGEGGVGDKSPSIAQCAQKKRRVSRD